MLAIRMGSRRYTMQYASEAPRQSKPLSSTVPTSTVPAAETVLRHSIVRSRRLAPLVQPEKLKEP